MIRRLQTIEQLMAENILLITHPSTIKALNNKEYPANDILKGLVLNNSNNEFQAVNIGRNKFKLIPTSKNLNIFLYRGQNAYYEPCLSSIDRNNISKEQKIIDKLKKIEFIEFLKKHPVINELLKLKILDCSFDFNFEELAQHYGFLTNHIDLTNNEDIAMFFATTEYVLEKRTYRIITDQENRNGVLYKLIYNFSNKRINIIGAQALERPTLQRAFSINMLQKEDFNKISSHKKQFKITTELSKKYFDMFDGGKKLMPNNSLINKVYEIQDKKTILKDAIKIYVKEYNLEYNDIKRILLNNDYTISSKIVKFTKKESQKITKEWLKNGKELLYKKIKYRY